MDELRWILLIFGVLLIAALYFFERLKRRGTPPRMMERWFGQERTEDFSMAPRPNENEDAEHYRDALAGLSSLMSERRRGDDQDTGAPSRSGPTLPAAETGAHGGEPVSAAGAGDQVESPIAAAGIGQSAAVREERLLVLYLKAPADHVFAGPALFGALATAGLTLGDMGIYHDRDEQGTILFSVANLFEPGTLATDNADAFSTRGLALFMQLPGPADEAAAFDRMLAKAEFLAERLGGELQDEHHQPLDRTAIERLRGGLSGG